MATCINCGFEFDDDFSFCPKCGTTKPKENNRFSLNLGDGNAVNGGISIHETKTSNDIHYHNIQERAKTEHELKQEKINEYHDAVARLIKNGIVSVDARAQLEGLKFKLGLGNDETIKIEDAVRNEHKAQVKATNDGLSVIGKMALKSAVTAVEENSPQASSCIRKLAPICKTTMNEQIHFFYGMLMAAFEPENCVQTYETRTVDSYWMSFWASIAYRKIGNEEEAESILSEMTGMWNERPEINVIINACIGLLISGNGNLSECQDSIIEYLTQTSEEPSTEITDLYNSLLFLVGVIEEDSPRYAFYRDYFFSTSTKEEINQQSNIEESVKENEFEFSGEEEEMDIPNMDLQAWNLFYDEKASEAKKIWGKMADRGSLSGLYGLGYLCRYQMEYLDIKKAEDYFKSAIAKPSDENPLAYELSLCELGGMYVGEMNKPSEARKYFQMAIDQFGSGQAKYDLAMAIRNGNIIAKDKNEGPELLNSAAQSEILDAVRCPAWKLVCDNMWVDGNNSNGYTVHNALTINRCEGQTLDLTITLKDSNGQKFTKSLKAESPYLSSIWSDFQFVFSAEELGLSTPGTYNFKAELSFKDIEYIGYRKGGEIIKSDEFDIQFQVKQTKPTAQFNNIRICNFGNDKLGVVCDLSVQNMKGRNIETFIRWHDGNYAGNWINCGGLNATYDDTIWTNLRFFVGTADCIPNVGCIEDEITLNLKAELCVCDENNQTIASFITPSRNVHIKTHLFRNPTVTVL